MAFLHFPKLSQYPRRREPVSVGIPWSQGRLPDPTHLLILDGDTPLPTQVQVLGTWPDGSVRWSLVHFQPDLPGNKTKDFQLEVGTAAVPVEPEEQVSVAQHGTEWRVNTGPLNFALHQGSVFALHDVSLKDNEFWSGLTVGALQMRLVEYPDSLEPMIERVEVEESGPLRAVIHLQGNMWVQTGLLAWPTMGALRPMPVSLTWRWSTSLCIWEKQRIYIWLL